MYHELFLDILTFFVIFVALFLIGFSSANASLFVCEKEDPELGLGPEGPHFWFQTDSCALALMVIDLWYGSRYC